MRSRSPSTAPARSPGVGSRWLRPAAPAITTPLTIATFIQNTVTCQISTTLATELDQDYLLEFSEDPVNWSTAEPWTGGGANHAVINSLASLGRQFLRVSKDDGGGGG